MELDSKEDHQTGNTNATGERRAKHVGILLPPPFVAALHVVVENVSNDEGRPSIGEVVWGPHKNTGQYERNINIADPRVGEALSEEVEGDGEKSTGKEAPFQRVVDAMVTVDARRADDSPDNRCSEECVSV